MGTNYYWHEKHECETCGRPYEPKHIGKSSMGWVFALHVYPENGIADIDDWERLWAMPGSKILDEYGREVTVAEMRAAIMARARPDEVWKRSPALYDSWEEFHAANNSERGPAGLLRTRGGYNFVRHGAGTWDCFTGDFS